MNDYKRKTRNAGRENASRRQTVPSFEKASLSPPKILMDVDVWDVARRIFGLIVQEGTNE